MTDIQLKGMQLAIDILSILAPMAITLTVGVLMIRLFLGFVRGKV